MEQIKNFIVKNWLWIVTYFLLVIVSTPNDSEITWRNAIAGVWVVILAFFHLKNGFEN